MDKLFEESCSFDNYEYKHILEVALDADIRAAESDIRAPQPDNIFHEQKCVIITKDNIKIVNKIVLIKKFIECLYFVNVDFGEDIHDDKYWFFVGKFYNNSYFIYESGCCATGFIGSKSSLTASKSQELLYNMGLTDKQRDMITNNINQNQRFKCSDAKLCGFIF